MAMWFYGWESLTVDHQAANFSSFRQLQLCDSRDKANLIFHVILQDHVIEGPCDFMERRSSFYIPALPNSVATGIVVGDI